MTFIKERLSLVINNKKKLLIKLLIALLMILTAYLLELFVSNFIYNSYFIWQRFLFFGTVFFSSYFIYTFKEKPEKVFLCLSLTIGFLYAVTTPISLSSWDEESHYPFAIQQSSLVESYFTLADLDIRSIPKEDYFNKELREISLKAKNESGNVFSHSVKRNFLNSYHLIGHTPSGIGIFLGRLFGLPWSVVFIMGRVFNVICYSIVCYFAIKKLKSGKMILSVICLFPTAIFLASNYSYDFWVNAFAFLGFSYFLSERQQPDKKLTVKETAIMIGALILACGPKAIYFPLFFLCFFIPKEKFPSKSFRRNYYILISASALLVVFSFILPFISNYGSDFGDMRGGSDVNSTEQVKFIFNNLSTYTGTLLGFLSQYLSISNSWGYTTWLAYLGANSFCSYTCIVLLFVTAFTDKNQHDKFVVKNFFRLKSYSIVFITVCLVATSLYVAFTPVGLDTINGCQARYLLPLIFPIYSVLGSCKIRFHGNKAIYNLAIFATCNYLLLHSIYSLCVSQYN